MEKQNVTQSDNGGNDTYSQREHEDEHHRRLTTSWEKEEPTHKLALSEAEENEPQSMNYGPLLTPLNVRENEKTHDPHNRQTICNPKGTSWRECMHGCSIGFPSNPYMPQLTTE